MLHPRRPGLTLVACRSLPPVEHRSPSSCPGLGLDARSWTLVRQQLDGPSSVLLLPSLGQPAPRGQDARVEGQAERLLARLPRDLIWLTAFLHDHHQGEDTGLYPMVRAEDPSLGPILDVMDGEHAAIHPAMEALAAAAARWKVDPEAAPAVLAAVRALEAVLNPHLMHEEQEMMPLVERTITQRQWHEWDQATNVKSKGPRELAYTGHWLIDQATPEDVHVVVHEVPAVPRFVLLHFMGGTYKRRRTAMWAGTPAGSLPPLRADAAVAVIPGHLDGGPLRRARHQRGDAVSAG
jgi:hypothetical protein